MGFFNLSAILITLSAAFAYINTRFIRLPRAIGLMLISLIFSLLLIAAGKFSPLFAHDARALVESVDFEKAVLNGMLSFLLFAGALHVNLHDLARSKWTILILAAPGTVLSAIIVAVAMQATFTLFGAHVDFIYCLLFGALISPTDPIAVLGLLKSLGVPKELQTKITGESLMNDGVAVVLFLGLLGVLTGEHNLEAGMFMELFLIEAGGGILLGLLLGYMGHILCKGVDDYIVEVLITLAIVMGGYSLSEFLHTSGPLAMVMAGLLMGNHSRELAMSERTRERVDGFWEMIDEIFNAVLFVLIGLEVLIISLETIYLEAGLIAIPIVLLARLVAVSIPVTSLRHLRPFPKGSVAIMTWGGLRGGVSVALALALPPGEGRDLVLTMTYTVVIFSILVQGLTLRFLIPKQEDPTAPLAD
ncbi:MAG: sodium:proton antiporter [Verrucomicrobiota bacterium]